MKGKIKKLKRTTHGMQAFTANKRKEKAHYEKFP